MTGTVVGPARAGNSRNVTFFPVAVARMLAARTGPGFMFPAMTAPSKDPLHGVTLEQLLTELEAHYGWEELGRRIDIRCFNYDPSVQSSLKFLRKTPWARAKVETLYVRLKTS